MFRTFLVVLISIFTLVSCGGGGGGGSSAPPSSGAPAPEGNAPQPKTTVKVKVQNLSHSDVRFSLNGSEALVATQDGTFAFLTALGVNDAFNVQITQQPSQPAVTCVISGAVGIIASLDPLVLTVDCQKLLSIKVDSNITSVPIGTANQYKAFALYQGGVSKEITNFVSWTSSDSSTVSVGASTGLSSAIKAGSASVTASWNTNAGVLTNSKSLLVTSATLSSISIGPFVPALTVGLPQKLVVSGLFSDGSVRDVSSQVTWSSSQSSIASVDAGGVVTPASVGSAVITATLSSKSASWSATVTSVTLDSIEVSPPVRVLGTNTSAKFIATGLFSDGSYRDLSSQVTWSSDAGAIAAFQDLSVVGKVTALTEGNATLSATLNAVSGTAKLVVSNKTLSSIAINMPVTSIPVGFSRSLNVIATYSDASTQDVTSLCDFTSTDEAIINLSAQDPGLLSALSVGSATIAVSYLGQSQNIVVTSTNATLSSLSLSPANLLISKAINFRYSAEGVFSDGSRLDLTSDATFTSSNTAKATITASGASAGELQNKHTGSTTETITITATYGAVSTNTKLIITPASLTSLLLNYKDSSLKTTGSLNLKAYGVFSDGASSDLSNLVRWSSSNSSVAVVSNASQYRGQVTPLVDGTAVVTASFNSLTTSLNLTVAEAAAESKPENGIGLRASYFSGKAFNTLAGQRFDATIDFNWALGTAPMGVGDAFSVRWEGFVTAPYSGVYTFYTRSDDGVRLWINNVAVVNNWTDHAELENSGTITLVAGQKYSVKMEFYENGGYAVSKLLWSHTSIPKATVPRSMLTPP